MNVAEIYTAKQDEPSLVCNQLICQQAAQLGTVALSETLPALLEIVV
jgi:hypothetical protein